MAAFDTAGGDYADRALCLILAADPCWVPQVYGELNVARRRGAEGRNGRRGAVENFQARPPIASQIGEHAKIIAFLIHGYAEVYDRLLWHVLESKLPVQRREVDELRANDRSGGRGGRPEEVTN